MAGSGADLRIEVTTVAGTRYTLVRPLGELDLTTYPALRDGLLKCGAELPDAVIVDVGGLRIVWAGALTVFATVWMRLGDWPGVPLVLVSRDVLPGTALRRFVPVYPDLDSALRSLARPLPRRRATFDLPWDLASAATARSQVRATCQVWGIAGDVTEDAAAIATEFVENTLVHTHSPAVLRLDFRRGLLTIAVADDDPTPAVACEHATAHGHGFGLRLARQLAKTWGCTPALNGGKVVWAVVRVPN
jgi:anti-sigma regulatory factor (Ser/Thr protein kinase)